MPVYSFKNKKTKRCFDKFMKIAELDVYLKQNPHIVQEITVAPAIGDSIRLGKKKPDTRFKDVLKNIKKKHPGSTINTFD